MATTPLFWWYPDSGSTGSIETTDLGEDLSALEETPIRAREETVSRIGVPFTVLTGQSRLAVRIVLERFTSAVLWRALAGMSAHLERGNPVGFAVDQTKQWAGFSLHQPSRGDTVLNTTGHAFYGSATIAANDAICIEGCGDQGLREYAVVSAVSGNNLTINTGLKYTYDDDVVLIRHADFWPLLWLPPAAQGRYKHLTTTRRIHYTLDLELETSPGSIAAYCMVNPPAWLAALPSQVGVTLEHAYYDPVTDLQEDDLVQRYRRAR